MKRVAVSLALGGMCLGTGCATSGSSNARLALYEQKTDKTTVFSVNTRTLRVMKSDAISGAKVERTSKYGIRHRKLVISGQALADADEILFQGEVDRDDIVVVRVEYNSVLGPWKLLSAMAGHPVQVSKIVLLKIDDRLVMDEQVLAREEYSYRWSADLFR